MPVEPEGLVQSLGRERRFRGRVVATVRCAPSKHLLGLVYPTAGLPVFVPTASHISRLQRRKDRTPNWLDTLTPELQAMAKKDPQFVREHGHRRDVWIQEEWQLDGTVHAFYIVGMTVIGPAPGYLESIGHVSIPLMCRCGERSLHKTVLRRAVAEGDRRSRNESYQHGRGPQGHTR